MKQDSQQVDIFVQFVKVNTANFQLNVKCAVSKYQLGINFESSFYNLSILRLNSCHGTAFG